MKNYKISRREWSKLTILGIIGSIIPIQSCSSIASRAAKPTKLTLGVQTYSLRSKSLEESIKILKNLNVKSCELWSGHVEPRNFRWKPGLTKAVQESRRKELSEWRSNFPEDEINEIRERFAKAKIEIQAYNATFKRNASNEEVNGIFKITQALGTNVLTTSSHVDDFKRAEEFADKHKIVVGMHNHSNVNDINEYATIESFKNILESKSEYIKLNLDIGHFAASNFDTVDFLKQHHEKVISVHIKDRLKDNGKSVEFGNGDTPIIEVLNLIKENQWQIPANIEYDYAGEDPTMELEKCLNYCKRALEV